MEYEEAISYDNLLKELNPCIAGTLWKDSTARYWIHRLKNTYLLWQDLHDGTYCISIYLWFLITEPKEREIYASYIRDRQLQHALIDLIVYPAVSRTFIAGNCACQKGKGTKYCIDFFVMLLRKYARVHGYEGYVLQCDIKKFFPSTHHDVACEVISKYVDPKTAKACCDVVRSFAEFDFAKMLMTHGMEKKQAHLLGHKVSSYLLFGGEWEKVIKGLPEEIIKAIEARIKEGDFKGVGLGSQVIQTVQVTLLSGMDHYITETLGIKVYVRYMDDFILAHESKEYLKYCRTKIEEYLATLKLVLNPKTQLYPLKRGIILLHWRIRVSVTGKVIVHKHRVKINRERRRLLKHRKQLDAGKMTMKDIETSFQCWQSGLLQQKCYMQVICMRRFYRIIFDGRRAPEWNSKYRRLKMQEKIVLSSMTDRSYPECLVNGMKPL